MTIADDLNSIPVAAPIDTDLPGEREISQHTP